ncbi:MAG: 30S ribosomal protein S8 [Kiritimatiellia bacterium]
MSWSDPIADMLTRIRNAQNAGLADVEMPASRMKEEIARILKAEGYILAYSTEAEGARRTLRLTLKYDAGEQPAIRGLRRVSKAGLRRFCGCREIPRVLGGMGIAVISTPAGVMTGAEAGKKRLGGEIICEIW